LGGFVQSTITTAFGDAIPDRRSAARIVSAKYRPDIDGLRAVAIAAVFVFHVNPQLVRGGFVGVDVFFVISGFLIIRIILDGLRTDTFSLAGFYARRIRRIFPALIVVLAGVWALGWYFMLPEDFQELGNWHGFASRAVAIQAPPSGRNPRVTAIATADYHTAARRPINSRFDCRLFAKVFGICGGHWTDGVDATTRALVAASAQKADVA
jgi:hypothetical protein